MKKDPARIGVVGAGYWGANLVRNCANLGVLSAVCDADLHALDAVRSKYADVQIYCDYETMLRSAKLDAVVIASPAPMHAGMALAAIRAGKHVFVEKPLALTVEDAEKVGREAQDANLVLCVGHVLLYHPAVRTMLELIREGKIGSVRHLRSRRLSWGRLRAQENVWWSFAPHDCALVYEVFGEFPQELASSQSAFINPGLSDFAYADFRFANGATAHIEVSWLDPDKSSRIDVFGSQGTLTLVDSREGATLTFTPCGDRKNEAGNAELWREEPQPVSLPQGEPLRIELESFIAALQGGALPPTDGAEGLAVVRMLSTLDTTPAFTSKRLEAIA